MIEKTLVARQSPAGVTRSLCHCFRTKSRSTWLQPFRVNRRVGVSIAARKPTESRDPPLEAAGSSWSTSPCFSRRMKAGDFWMLLKSRAHLLPGLGSRTAKNCEFTKLDIPIERCGALLDTGLPCNALPVRGRKRCRMHKDLKSTKRRGSKQQQQQQGHATATITGQQIRNYQLGSWLHEHSVGSRNTRSAKECLKGTSQHEAAAMSHNSRRSDVMEPQSRSFTISCLPLFLLRAAGMRKHECKTQDVIRSRVSLSFSTWLKTSRSGMMTGTEITAVADAATAAAAAAIKLKTSAATSDHTSNNNMMFSKVELQGLQNEDLFELIVHNIYGSSTHCHVPPITHTMMQQNCPSHYSIHAEIGIWWQQQEQICGAKLQTKEVEGAVAVFFTIKESRSKEGNRKQYCLYIYTYLCKPKYDTIVFVFFTSISDCCLSETYWKLELAGLFEHSPASPSTQN